MAQGRSPLLDEIVQSTTRRSAMAFCSWRLLINVWDYRVEQSHPEYNLDNMFLNPVMRDELQLQSHYIESLRKERHE